MSSYDDLRRRYKPERVEWLFVAESPPPQAHIPSSRHFYRAPAEGNDRLFINTMKALFSDVEGMAEAELERDKETWLRRFQVSGCYMIEALETSQRHEVTGKDRQEKIKAGLPRLIERIRELKANEAKILLIKSNVFIAAAEALRRAGFKVLNRELIDYPGQFNQRRFREKVQTLMAAEGWKY